MQETQHTQQTTTRTAKNQDIETAWMKTNIKHRRLTNTRNKHLLGDYLRNALERLVTSAPLGFKPGLRALNLTLTSLRIFIQYKLHK